MQHRAGYLLCALLTQSGFFSTFALELRDPESKVRDVVACPDVKVFLTVFWFDVCVDFNTYSYDVNFCYFRGFFMAFGLSLQLRFAAVLFLSVGMLSACSSSQYGEVYDPAETVNRGIFKFNNAVDEAVLEPVAKGYRAAVPQPARTGVRNALRNLKTPTILANNLLQADLTGAGNTLTRFFANTLFGLGGLVDVAGSEGVAYREEDFGQTLGVWGMGHGPYVVLPLFGPSSVRDTTGFIVDGYTDPVRIWLMNSDNEGWYYGRVAVATVDKREELLDVLSDLKRNSVDYYAAMRSAYIQKRDAQVRGNDDADLPDIP